MKKSIVPGVSIKETVYIGLFSAVLFAAQVALAPLPNIELVTLLVILYSLHFHSRAVYIIYVFVLLEGLVFGFGIWWISYLYVWTILYLVTRLFQRNTSPVFWALAGALFGLLFGVLTAFPYLAAGGLHAAWAYFIAGIPFDLAHCAGNFLSILILFAPANRLLGRISFPLRAEGGMSCGNDRAD